MPEYSDIYVISNKRNREALFSFLDEFVPEREESCDEYLIPEFSENPIHIYQKADKVIDWCVSNKNEPYSVYWRSKSETKPEHAMVFYLKDGYVIYGLSTDAAFEEYAIELLNKLKIFIGSEVGYIAHEASPNCECYEEFENECRVWQP